MDFSRIVVVPKNEQCPYTAATNVLSQIPPCKPGRQAVDSSSSYRVTPCQLLQFQLAGGSRVLLKKEQAKKTEVRMRVSWKIWASQQEGVREPVGSISTSDDEETTEGLKRAVMKAVSNTNRGKDTTYQQRQSILKLIEELEKLNPTANPIESQLFSGRWALLYTAPVDEKTADKYAGTEEGPFLARVKPAAFGSVRQIRSTQVLDTQQGTAQNIADFTFFGINGSLNIKGSVAKAGPTLKGATRVDVTFESFLLKFGDWTSSPVSLSWISPKGWIETTFLDKDMRIGRGDKGSIFVAVRMNQS